LSPQPNDPLEWADLHNIVLPDAPLTDLLQRITDMAGRSVPNCGFAGLTVSRDGRPQTPIFTDERSPQIDQAQYDSGRGPCLDAFRDGTSYRIDDIATEQRWPEFCKAAEAAGVASTLSLPLGLSAEETLGALNLYSETPHAFDAAAQASADSFVHQASVVLANARAYWGAVELADHLQTALESRAAIEQAKGIIMARGGISADEAFDILVRASQRSNTKLRDVANDMVEKTIERGLPPA
jgi:GAF domain-containing protein